MVGGSLHEAVGRAERAELALRVEACEWPSPFFYLIEQAHASPSGQRTAGLFAAEWLTAVGHHTKVVPLVVS